MERFWWWGSSQSGCALQVKFFGASFSEPVFFRLLGYDFRQYQQTIDNMKQSRRRFVVIHNRLTSVIDFSWNSPAGFPANLRQHTGDWVLRRFLSNFLFFWFHFILWVWYSESIFRRGFLLLALAVLLLGFIVAFVVYDLRNRNKQLHPYMQLIFNRVEIGHAQELGGVLFFWDYQTHCWLRVN